MHLVDIPQWELPKHCQFSCSYNHWHITLTIKYPGPQHVNIIPSATDTLRLPNNPPATVGVAAKNPPFAAPLRIQKTIRGPTVVENGQITSILNALSRSEIKSVFMDPMLSHIMPQSSLPTAEEKLNAATKPAAAVFENPSVLT